jgi:membrane protein implicated in regulation of membrane protease activity
MPWWGWIILGLLLLGSELAFLDAAFYLVFIGAAAAVVGLVLLGGILMPFWAQWILFAVLAIVAMVLFRQRLYQFVRGRGKGWGRTLVDDFVRIEESLAPGQSCRIQHRGSSWTARNKGELKIDSGDEVRVISVDGLTLNVSKES